MKCHTISSTRMLNTYLVAAAALATAARTVTAAKTPEFPCTDGWTNASSTNEFDCSGSSVTTFISDSAVWSTFVPAAIGILCLIPISCIIVFGRYCCNCCGSSKVRPNSFCGGQCCGEDPDDNLSDEQKAPLYSDRCIYAVRFLCVFAAVAAIAGFVLNYVGGSRVAGGVRDVDPTLDNVAGWAMGILDELKAGVVDPNNSSKYPTGFDEEMFTSAAANIRSYQKDAKDVVADYSDKAILVSEIIGYVTAAPAVVLLLPIVSAFFCVRRFLPLIFILLSFFFQFVYFVFSSVCLILVLAFTMLHEDVTTTSSDQRSVTQWYLIPRCEVEAPFDDAKTNVAEMEKNACIEACTELLNFCDNTNVWLMDEKIFYCDLTDANTCTDLTILNTIVDGMHTKATVPAAAGCGDEAAAQGQTCDIDLCATNCTQAAARNAASSAVENLATANRVKNAYTTILLPYMSCSVLLTKTVSIGIESVILQLRDGSTLLATGSLLISCGLIIAIIGGFLGQKRFLNKAQLMASVADGGASPHPIAADKMGTSTGDFSLSSPYGNEKAARGAANRNAKPSYESQMYDEAMTERAAPQRK